MENLGRFIETDTESKTVKRLVLDERTEQKIVVSFTTSFTFLFAPIRCYLIRAVPESAIHAESLKRHVAIIAEEENAVICAILYNEALETEEGYSKDMRFLIAKRDVVSRMPDISSFLPPR